MTDLGRWFHARGGFAEVEATGPKLAKEAIERSRVRLSIEQAAVELSTENRVTFRQRHAES